MAGPGSVGNRPSRNAEYEPVDATPKTPGRVKQQPSERGPSQPNTIARHPASRDTFEMPAQRLDMNNLPTLSPAQLNVLSEGGRIGDILGRSGNQTLEGFVSGLKTLSKDGFNEAMSRLCDSGRFAEVMSKLDADPALRKEFLQVALKNGVVEATPSRARANPRPLPAPEQPSLIRNDPALKHELRTLIHHENRARATDYTTQVDRYTKDWCATVMNAKTPGELRGLGPFSAAPSMSEPGVTERDAKAFGWKQGLTEAGRGTEQAARALGDKISDLRGEPRAGSYSLDLEVSRKDKVGSNGSIEVSTGAKAGTFGVKPTANVKAGVEAKLGDKNTHVKAEISGDVRGAGSVALKGKASGFEVGVETAVDAKGKTKTTLTTMMPNGESPATYGVYSYAGTDSFGAGLKGKLKLGDTDLGAKVGFSAYGVPREYYQDIGGTQSGLFGPMPEFEAGVSWKSLKPDRREWYSRQGFSEQNWSVR